MKSAWRFSLLFSCLLQTDTLINNCSGIFFLWEPRWKLVDCTYRDLVLILCKGKGLEVRRRINRTLKNNIHSDLRSVPTVVCIVFCHWLVVLYNPVILKHFKSMESKLVSLFCFSPSLAWPPWKGFFNSVHCTLCPWIRVFWSRFAFLGFLSLFRVQVPVVQKMDYAIHLSNNWGHVLVVRKVIKAIHRLNLYPLHITIGFPYTYPLDKELSLR